MQSVVWQIGRAYKIRKGKTERMEEYKRNDIKKERNAKEREMLKKREKKVKVEMNDTR